MWLFFLQTFFTHLKTKPHSLHVMTQAQTKQEVGVSACVILVGDYIWNSSFEWWHWCSHLPLFCNNTGGRRSLVWFTNNPHDCCLFKLVTFPFQVSCFKYSNLQICHCIAAHQMWHGRAFDLLAQEGICLPQFKLYGDNVFFELLHVAVPSVFCHVLCYFIVCDDRSRLLGLNNTSVRLLQCFWINNRVV